MKVVRYLAFTLCIGFASCQAEEVTLIPSADNTIFEDNDNLSNGVGSHLFAGATATRNNDLVRRALLKFDVAGDVPAGATVNSVSLDMRVNKVPPRQVANDMGLHRVLTPWGEGASDAPGQEGRGTAAVAGDATWSDNVLGAPWEQPGGDFVEIASSITNVGGRGLYTWDSTDMLVEDVQNWLVDPDMNFGWILIGDEETSRTAKRFGSRESSVEADRPTLTISFDITSALAGDFNADGDLDASDISLLCGAIGGDDASFDTNGDDIVNLADLIEWVQVLKGTLAGDANLNGEVAFNDFLIVSNNFGQDGKDWSTGDFDCSGNVVFADFLLLANNFGKSPAAGSASLATVPEPTFGGLFGLALVLCLSVRRKRHVV